MHCIINNQLQLVPNRFNIIVLKALVKVGVQKVRTKTIQVCFGMVENKSASDLDRRLNSIVWIKSDEKVISVNNFAWRSNSKI